MKKSKRQKPARKRISTKPNAALRKAAVRYAKLTGKDVTLTVHPVVDVVSAHVDGVDVTNALVRVGPERVDTTAVLKQMLYGGQNAMVRYTLQRYKENAREIDHQEIDEYAAFLHAGGVVEPGVTITLPAARPGVVIKIKNGCKEAITVCGATLKRGQSLRLPKI
jgi:hypothetical protein